MRVAYPLTRKFFGLAGSGRALEAVEILETFKSVEEDSIKIER